MLQRTSQAIALVAAAFLGFVLAASAEQATDRDVKWIENRKLTKPKTVTLDKVDPFLLNDAAGTHEVIVNLKTPSIAKVDLRTRAECIAHKKKLQSEQSSFMQRTSQLTSPVKETGSVQTLLNAVFLEMDTAEVAKLAADPAVESIHRVQTYDLFLSETAPYIGAIDVQETYGYDGTGIKVAVLDSGIDYTHANLGGEGTQEAFDAAFGDNTLRDGLFPTAKVVEGYDFVGENWPVDPVMPDEDPIDIQGHGTHVADIIGGKNGIAPAVELFAVKVCAGLNGTGCNGRAMIQGMDYAVDPNGDGDTSDAADIINLSLGKPYGQPFDDDMSQSVESASALGVVVVAAAGNSFDKPYIASTPAAALSAISVAQTASPSAFFPVITVDDIEYMAIFQNWSMPLEKVITAPLQYGDGNGGNTDGCLPFDANSLAGKTVLVDRGECNFTLKIKHIGEAGGVVGIIGQNVPGSPFPGGDGDDGPITIPAYMVSQADANAMKESIPSLATFDPEMAFPANMRMIGSSARGPVNQNPQRIKPEIGAPGTSVSAVAGGGTLEEPFGGTSGAAPVVAGAAALLLQAFPGITPTEVKARLMNNAETGIRVEPFEGNDLAPISRIGGGEVRVDRALTAPAAAWDDETSQAALSYGFVDVNQETRTLYKRIRIRNYSDEAITYTITPSFRYQNDADTGAISLEAVAVGNNFQVSPGRDRVVLIRMKIKGDKLPNNFMDSGQMGANSTSLSLNEYDGYLLLDDGSHPLSLPWHILPRKAANLVGPDEVDFGWGNPAALSYTNTGVGTAQIDGYSWIAWSQDIPEGKAGENLPNPDIRAVGVRTLEVPPDFCSPFPSFVWAFAISTWERQQHLRTVSFNIGLDVDRDGFVDYTITNRDVGSFDSPPLTDGSQVTWAVSGISASTNFFAEHSMNTGNTVLAVCAEQVGMNSTDVRSTSVDVEVNVQDVQFGGPGDSVRGLTITPGGERFVVSTEDLGPGEEGEFLVTDRGSFGGNTEELGIMLLSDGDRGEGLRGAAAENTEVLLVSVA